MRNAIILIISICVALTAGADLYAQDSLNVELVGWIYNQWFAAYDVVVVSDLAYVAAERSGLQIVDVSNPENPKIIGYWDDNPDEALDVTVSGDYAYVAGRSSGLRVISVADPEHPQEVGYYDTDGFAHAVKVSGDYAYVAAWEGGLYIISIVDPEHPEEVGFYDTDDAWGVMVSGDYAYVADYSLGLRVISVADPEHPQEVGYYDTDGHAMGLTVSGDYAYVADGDSGLRVISIADPEHPDEVGYCDTYWAVDVTVSGDYAYIADREHGLLVISVADPENPEEVGYYDTPGAAFGVALSENGLIYVADNSYMGIYRFTDPTEADDSFIPHPSSLILLPAYPNPFNSSTTITYGLGKPTPTRLVLYNLSGQRMTTLFEGYRQPGIHTATLTADDLASGLYFVRLEASGEVATRKVMLIR